MVPMRSIGTSEANPNSDAGRPYVKQETGGLKTVQKKGGGHGAAPTVFFYGLTR